MEPSQIVVSKEAKEAKDATKLVESKDKSHAKYVQEMKFVKPEDRISSEYMNQFEYARVLCIRAKQIENGSPMFIEPKEAYYSDPMPAKRIAEEEIAQGRCPLSIVRQMAPGVSELWDVNELKIKDL